MWPYLKEIFARVDIVFNDLVSRLMEFTQKNKVCPRKATFQLLVSLNMKNAFISEVVDW